jgi:hypothetical protein
MLTPADFINFLPILLPTRFEDIPRFNIGGEAYGEGEGYVKAHRVFCKAPILQSAIAARVNDRREAARLSREQRR